MKFKIGILAVLLAFSALAVGQQNTLWLVGLARVDITPTDSLWMAGYAARDHAAEGTMHPLWAKALVVQDAAGRRGVLVTMDLLGLPKRLSDDIRAACTAAYGLERAQIILSSSHTHSGPVLRDALYDIYPLDESRIAKIEAYSDQLKKDIVRLIGSALDDMAPANLFSSNGVVRFQVNRRNNNASTLDAQSDLNGPNDYAVPVLQVRNPEGGLRAVAFGYACHATVLNGYEWSGDYPGFAQIALEQKYPGAQAMFFQGCGADQNPLPRREVGLARQYGQELAAAVERVTVEPGEALAAELQTAYTEIELALTSPPSIDALEKQSRQGSDYQKRWARRMLAAMQAGQPLASSYSYPVQVWRLGGQALFVLGGEVVVDYAIQLKRIFGQHVFVMAYSNDVMAYIPSVRVLREGGYEGLTSQIVYGLPGAWEADIESRILRAAIRLAQEAGVQMPEARVLKE